MSDAADHQHLRPPSPAPSAAPSLAPSAPPSYEQAVSSAPPPGVDYRPPRIPGTGFRQAGETQSLLDVLDELSDDETPRKPQPERHRRPRFWSRMRERVHRRKHGNTLDVDNGGEPSSAGASSSSTPPPKRRHSIVGPHPDDKPKPQPSSARLPRHQYAQSYPGPRYGYPGHAPAPSPMYPVYPANSPYTSNVNYYQARPNRGASTGAGIGLGLGLGALALSFLI